MCGIHSKHTKGCRGCMKDKMKGGIKGTEEGEAKRDLGKKMNKDTKGEKHEETDKHFATSKTHNKDGENKGSGRGFE